MIKAVFKKLLWIIVAFIVIDVGILVALPHFLPKEKIQQMVSDASGGKVTYGDVSVVFWPNVGIELKNVVLADKQTSAKQASIGRLDVAVAVMPLLDRHVVVKQFALDEPVLYGTLTENNGSMTFSSGLQPPPQEAPPRPAPVKSLDEKSSAPSGFDVQFDKIKITNGRLVATNQQDKAFVDKISINIKKTGEGSALQVDGGLAFKGKKIDLSLGLDKPQDFIAGKASPGQVSVKTEDFTFKADGLLATQGTFLKGSLEFDAPSMARVLDWVPGVKVQKPPFEKVSFSSSANVSAADIILKDATLKLDDVEARGSVNVGLSGKPDIFARLSLNKLNLDRFTGEAGADKGAASGGDAKKSAGSQDWDTAPIDFSGLKAVNADLKLQTQGFALRGAEVGPSTLTVTLQNGDLRFKSSEASLFGGTFASDLALNANTNAISFNFDTSGVQAKPVLTTFAHFKKLSGTAEGHVALTAAGNSQKAIISSLGGKGSLVFRNGSLEGIDLVKIAKMVQSHLSNMGVGEGKTDFVEMGGTFTIASGVASNSDLKMKGPLLQATGKGTLDLPRKYIKYRATPVLTASSAAENAQGLAVPVDITGPFSDIKVVPDFASVVKNVIEHPEDVKATAKNVRDGIRDIRKDIRKDPGAAIQNLLGGNIGGMLGGGKQPQAAPETPSTVPAPAPAAAVPAPAPAPEAAPSPAEQTTTTP